MTGEELEAVQKQTMAFIYGEKFDKEATYYEVKEKDQMLGMKMEDAFLPDRHQVSLLIRVNADVAVFENIQILEIGGAILAQIKAV